MAYNLISKILCIFLMQAETVIFFVSVPLFQFDNQIHRLCILNALNTKQSFDIDNTNTTKFNEMSCDIRCRAHQRHITDFTKFYNIITDKTMSSFDQFQRSLTLANSALTCDQDTFTIYIHKHTMDGNTWCQLYTQPADNLSHKTGSCTLCHESRNIIFNCQIDHIL